MKILDRIIQILSSLTDEERKIFLKLAEQDETLIEKMLIKASRLRLAVDTGNVLLWKKIMNEDDRIFKSFIQDLHDQKEIIQIRKTIGIAS